MATGGVWGGSSAGSGDAIELGRALLGGERDGGASSHHGGRHDSVGSDTALRRIDEHGDESDAEEGGDDGTGLAAGGGAPITIRLSAAAVAGAGSRGGGGGGGGGGSAAGAQPSAAARARQALQRAARRAVLAKRVMQPTSSKGVPLFKRQSLATALGAAARLYEDGTSSNSIGEGGSGGGSGEHIPEKRVSLAARFVRDALANRSPNTRLAAAEGVSSSDAAIGVNDGGGASGGVPGSARSLGGSVAAAGWSLLQPCSVSRRTAARLEDVMASWWYRTLFQLVVLAHCLLAMWEHIPPSTRTPPFTWATGLIELAVLAFYT
jgi:hypothetical protein